MYRTAFGGKKPALFKRAVIQSAAYDAQIDRKVQLEKQFQDFAFLAGCAGKGLACLRAADLKTIKLAQEKYVSSMPAGKPGFGSVQLNSSLSLGLLLTSLPDLPQTEILSDNCPS
jgi:carboxylesterase type B